MATIQVRLEPNPLTTPPSWRIRFLPRNTAGCKDIAADIALDHPNYNKEVAENILEIAQEKILLRLINGENVTFANAFTYTLSFTGRLEGPDDPLPPLEECLHIRVYAAAAMTDTLHQDAHIERLPPEQRLPRIDAVQDTVLNLKNVLDPAGVLLLRGGDLFFDRSMPGSGECVLEGTQSGRTVQSRFVRVEPGEILLMPDVPAQAHPWNNEYIITVSIRYSEHGSLRSCTYSRMLRTPLVVLLGTAPGILTGKEAIPHVSVTNGTLTADETLRIQVIFDVHTDALLFSLLDMQEGGKTGTAVSVTANGVITLPGFSGSAVSSLSIEVNDYAALKDMIRNNYSSRLVDVLQVKEA